MNTVNIFEVLAKPLIDAALDRTALDSAYSAYVEALINSPLWSEESPTGVRVPWRKATLAAKHPTLSDGFSSKGLYLFGGAQLTPLYVGMTSVSLWKRLRGRYVCGKRCQCQLAVDYLTELVRAGLDGFPEEIRIWYRKNYGNSTARLEGAVEFAKSGPGDIWFTLIPTPDFNSKEVLTFEGMVIRTASRWNLAHGYPPLLNTQGVDRL